MVIDVEYGNITEHEAIRLAQAAERVDQIPHEPGSTEPWISRLVADFIIARGAKRVLETGTFKGATSVWIYYALAMLGGGDFYFCEADHERYLATRHRFQHLLCKTEDVRVFGHEMDVITFLKSITDYGKFDVAWVDDNHEKKHVDRELQLILPKMAPGGIVLLHDVYGSCDLKTVVRAFGGYSLDLPRLGPAGGLGIIQVPA